MTNPNQSGKMRFGTADAPLARREAARRSFHGIEDTLDLTWMRNHDDPELAGLLTAENEHFDAVMAPLSELIEQIESEIKAHTKEDDMSVPFRRGRWWYLSRTIEGSSYATHERIADRGDGKGPAENEPTVYFDENTEAGDGYFSLGIFDISPDGNLLAYAVDTDGSETHLLKVRDLRTGTELDVAIEGVSYGFGWATGSDAFCYTTLDHAERPWRVFVHRLGDTADGSADRKVLEEPDERFWVSVGQTRSGRFLMIDVSSAVTSELWLIEAAAIHLPPRLAIGRRDGIEFQATHHNDHLYLVTNAEGAEDFELQRVPINALHDVPEVLISHSPGTRLLGIEAFEGYLVVHLRIKGAPTIWVVAADALNEDPSPEGLLARRRVLAFDDAAYSLSGSANEEWKTDSYRFGYQSLVTPATVYEEDLATGDRRLLKQHEVLAVDLDNYRSVRVWATADDGTAIPISLVHHRHVAPDGTNPAVLYGYGSYEISIDPWWSNSRLSLLDRGVVFAVAHVRGGGELGRRWYEDGKLNAKPNSFTDFEAAAAALVEQGWAASGRIALRGGSAGGLLVGATVNLAPSNYAAIVAEVPFVDALNSILDPNAPLTVIEWEEWGNPIDSPEIFSIMRGYSPTENIKAEPYPAILASGGLHDPRVGIHEPAIWVQRLREVSSPDRDRPIILQVDLGAGHGGPSGRYEAWKREAETLAFILCALNAG